MFSRRFTLFPHPQIARLAAALVVVSALASAGCGGDLNSRLAEIRSLQQTGNFEASIEPLRGLVTTNSVHPEVNYRLGLALVQTGRQSLAIWPLQKAAGSSEFSLPAGLLLVNALIQTGDNEEAVRAAGRILAKDSDNKMALSARAQANLANSNPEGTLEDTQHLLTLNPQNVSTLIMQSAALADLGRLEEAAEAQVEAERIANEEGNLTRAGRTCAARGVLLMKTNEPDDARVVFEECVATYPGNTVVRTQATEFLVSEGDYAAAANLWQNAVEADPEEAANRARWSDLLRQGGQVEQAEAVLLEMVELFDSAEAWRSMSAFQRSTGNIPQALNALSEAIARASGNTESLRFEQADLMIEQGDLDGARAIAAELTEPSYTLLIEGASSMAEEDYAAALQSFESGLRRWPNNANARYLAGIASENLGDRPRALAEYREAIRNDITRTDAAFRLAQLHFQQGDFTAASGFVRTHLDNRPFDGPDAHLLAAHAAIRTQEYERASAVLQALLRRKEHKVVALVTLAEVTALAENPQQAASALQTAMDQDAELAGSAAMQHALVAMLNEAGETQEALAVGKAHLAAEPQNAVMENLIGRILLREQRVAEARAAFTRAMKIDPTAAEPRQGLGIIAFGTGDLAGARGHFEAGSQLAPASGEYPYRLAQILLAEGQQEAAIEELKRAIEIEPTHLGANNDLAWYLAETGGDLELALELAQLAVRLSPVAATFDTVGWVHLKRGDGDLAEQAFTSVIDNGGETSSALYHMALALVQQGRITDAIALLTKALSAGPFPESADANATLERLQGA
jgi:tetratricopeptide (TPR) repeat protein